MTDNNDKKPLAASEPVREFLKKGYVAGPLGNGFRPGVGEVQGGYIGPSSALPAFPNAPSGFNPANKPAAPAGISSGPSAAPKPSDAK